MIYTAKKKYSSPDDLQKAIDKYFSDCEVNNIAPKWQALLNYLDISQDTIERYNNNKDNKYPGFAEIIKKTVNRHSSFWQQYALDHPNSQTFCIFMLKQPYNGGLTDKQEVNQDIKVNLQIGSMNAKLAE